MTNIYSTRQQELCGINTMSIHTLNDPAIEAVRTAAWYLGRAIVILVDTKNRIVNLFRDTLQQQTRCFCACIHDLASALHHTLSRSWIVSKPFVIIPEKPKPFHQEEIREAIATLDTCKKLSREQTERLQVSQEAISALKQKRISKVATNIFGNGIVNGGYTCYLDSVIQALRFNPAFRKLLQAPKLKANKIAQELSRLFDLLEGTNGEKRLVTKEEINSFRRTCMQHGWDPSAEISQEDAAEFSQMLTNALGLPIVRYETDVKPLEKVPVPVRSLKAQGGHLNHVYLGLGEAPEHTEIADIAVGNVVIEVIDKSAVLPTLSDQELEEVFESLASMPIISYVHTRQTVKFYADNIPCVLPLPLKRYFQKPGTKESYKITRNIRPSETIDFPLIANNSSEDSPKLARYRLTSIVVHDGLSTAGGHYRTYVPAYTQGNDNKSEEIFLEFDDHDTYAHLATDAVLKDIEANGYVYFYELVGIITA